jgi:hypothetical protein
MAAALNRGFPQSIAAFRNSIAAFRNLIAAFRNLARLSATNLTKVDDIVLGN